MTTRPKKLARCTAMLAFTATLWLVGPGNAVASVQPSPDAVLEQTSDQMLTALDADHALLARDPHHIYDIVERLLVPHVDMGRASRWALGRHWRQATPAQRMRFEAEFHTLLVRFYSTALVEYLNTGHEIPLNVITFLPKRTTVNGDEARVFTMVQPRTGRTIPVSYDMHLGREGWKVYDVTVDGVSIITAYRSVFTSEIRKHGMEGLLDTLAAFNRRYAAND